VEIQGKTKQTVLRADRIVYKSQVQADVVLW